jgi:SAM-dependent methyltransferase
MESHHDDVTEPAGGQAGAFLELDEAREAAYMREHGYRFRALERALPVSSERLRVLDMGTTPNTLRIKKLRPNFDVWTLDLTDLLGDRCEAGGVRLRTCDLGNEPIPFEDGFFDLVIFTEVLEHLFGPPSDVLRETRRILRDGGVLILSVPNIATLYNRVKLLLGATPLPNPDQQMKKGWVHGYGHVHEYTAKEIASLVENCGFTISERRFLQERVGAVFDYAGTGRLHTLLRAGCRLLALGVPSFRTTIWMKCDCA